MGTPVGSSAAVASSRAASGGGGFGDAFDDRVPHKNVLGTALATCSTDPMTGYYRDGCCNTGPTDTGRHVVCARMTADFLEFTKSRGNDLSTPRGGFPGLRPGDRWCLCATRWKEALDAGHAPPVVLDATSEAALRYVTIEELLSMAVGADE